MMTPAPHEVIRLAVFSKHERGEIERDALLLSAFAASEPAEWRKIFDERMQKQRRSGSLDSIEVPNDVKRLQARLCLLQHAAELAALYDGRRRKIFSAACAMASYVTHGWVSAGDVCGALLEAWRSSGASDLHGLDYAKAAIANGLGKGENDDPPAPWQCLCSPDTSQRLIDQIDMRDKQTIGLIDREVAELVQRAEEDEGAPFEPAMLELLSTLKKIDESKFERLRRRLKASDCRVTQLDESLSQWDRRKTDDARSFLHDLIIEQFDLFHTPDEIPYATHKNQPCEAIRMNSEKMRQRITKICYEETGSALGKETLNSIVTLCAAKASFDGPKEEVYLRVARKDGMIYIDLADGQGTIIVVTKDGWYCTAVAPVKFVRPAGMLPLPSPIADGSIGKLKEFLNLASENDFTLTVGFLLCALRGCGPYFILAISGEQGSAKSTFSRVLRALIDPRKAALTSLTGNELDIFTAAHNSHLTVFDNLSGITPPISDALCRVATGGGFSKRQLFTDFEEAFVDVVRPLILNGIGDVVSRPDLADRSIFLFLEAISDDRRRSESDLLAEFERAAPGIMGALCDLLCSGLKEIDTVGQDRFTRMADCEKWVAACETVSWSAGTFAAAYSSNRRDAVLKSIDASPVASAIRKFVEKKSRERTERTVLSGTAGELQGEVLKILNDAELLIAGYVPTNKRMWPDSPASLGRILRYVKPLLRSVGIEIEFTRRGKDRERIIKLACTPLPEGSAES